MRLSLAEFSSLAMLEFARSFDDDSELLVLALEDAADRFGMEVL